MPAVLILWLLISPLTDGKHLNVCNPKYVRQIEGLAKGAVLMLAVHKGMDHNQVRSILGQPSFRAIEGGILFEAYAHFGIQVFWTHVSVNREDKRIWLVTEVRYVWQSWAVWNNPDKPNGH